MDKALQEVTDRAKDLLEALPELNELSAEERVQALAALERLTPKLDAAILNLKGKVG